MKKRCFKSIMCLFLSIIIFGITPESVFAEYNETVSNVAYAGSTRFQYSLHMENFSAYAYLDADYQSELYLCGYVEDRLGDYFNNTYTFSAGDQWGYSIGAGRETAYLTWQSHAEYRVDSEDGGCSTSLNLHE